MHAGSEKEKTASAEARELNKPDLAEAKARFQMAAEAFSPLGIVRRRPFASLGVAFAAGFGLSSLGGSRAAPPALDLAAQIAGIAASFAPLLASRARSSDG